MTIRGAIVNEPIKETLGRITKTARYRQKKQESQVSKCDKCEGTGFIMENKDGLVFGKKCECKLIQEVKQRKDNSGMTNLLGVNTFDSYKTNEEYQKYAKSLALEYVEDFLDGNRHSFAFLGQSGIGKSHLTVAISEKLLERGVDVKYFIADDIIQRLQACKFNEDNHRLEFDKIAECGLLVVDDLFKTSVTNYYNQESLKQDDLKEMFKVINHRYNKGLPILVSSEIHFERFGKLDQATIGRINEMCDYKYLISVKPDTNKNYRLAN